LNQQSLDFSDMLCQLIDLWGYTVESNLERRKIRSSKQAFLINGTVVMNNWAIAVGQSVRLVMIQLGDLHTT
jgi:hypothetical protein